MGAYNDIDRAILGLKADNNPVTKVISRSIQDSAGIGFGLPVFGYISDEENCYGYVLDTAKIVYSADFVASNSTVITIDGDALDAVVYATSHDNTMNLLITEITSEGYNASLDASDTDNRTIFIRKTTRGTAVGTVSSVTTAGASQPTATITYESDQVFLGITLFVAKDVNSSGTGLYLQYQSVSIVNIGKIWASVTASDNVDANTDAYLHATTGIFTKTAGETVNCKFWSDEYNNTTTSDAMAIVETKGQVKLNQVITWS